MQNHVVRAVIHTCGVRDCLCKAHGHARARKQTSYMSLPQIRRANCMFLGKIPTLLAWMARTLVSSKRSLHGIFTIFTVNMTRIIKFPSRPPVSEQCHCPLSGWQAFCSRCSFHCNPRIECDSVGGYFPDSERQRRTRRPQGSD